MILEFFPLLQFSEIFPLKKQTREFFLLKTYSLGKIITQKVSLREAASRYRLFQSSSSKTLLNEEESSDVKVLC